MSVEQLQQISEAIDVFFVKARRGERSLANFRRLLQANERKLSLAVSEWMKLMIGQLQKGLAQVKGRKARLTAERLADWKYVREQGEMILKPALLQVLVAGGNAIVGRKIIKQERFDPIGVEAVEWATEHSAELVTEVATETRKAIRTFIADGVNAGKSIPKIASELRPVVGLTDRYGGAVGKFATELYTSPKYSALSNAQRGSKIEQYANKLHRLRTETIARTETKNALWEGTFQGYGQMGITRVEGVSGPGACDWCIDNIDGKVYTIREARGVAEASHPSCSCAWVAARGEKPEVWKPATTMDGAREFALKNLVRAKGEVYYGKDICLKGANSINKNLYGLTKKYKKRPDFVGVPEGYKKWLKKIGAPGEAAEMGEADAFVQIIFDGEGRRRISIVLNPLNYEDIEAMKGVAELAKDLLVPQNWYKCENINTIIMHEYGHVLDHYKSDYLISNSLKFETDLLKVIVKEDKSIKQLLGGYAESGLQHKGAMYGESWAELFKLYEYDKKLLTKDLINLVEDTLKGG